MIDESSFRGPILAEFLAYAFIELIKTPVLGELCVVAAHLGKTLVVGVAQLRGIRNAVQVTYG